jgi:hypothetical protein
MNEVHGTWWLFDRWAERNYGEDYATKLKGIDVITAVRQFAYRNKKVKIVKCSDIADDSHGDKSILVVIPHPTMGKSIIFIPEKSDVQNIFFLYPKREKQLLKILNSIQL